MIIHVVKPGETLWQISNFYGVPLAETISANQLPNPNQLFIGQAIIIPKDGITYVVQPGETLWMIAQRFNTTIDVILRNNDIANPDVIFPGMRILIPTPLYQVMPGDTL